MAATTPGRPPASLASNNPFRTQAIAAGGDDSARNDIVAEPFEGPTSPEPIQDDTEPDRFSEDDEQLRRAIEASRQDTQPLRSPTMSSQESEELERALALSSAEHERRLPRSSNTPSPTKPPRPSAHTATPTKPGRSRSVSNPEALPPFPFTAQDLVRPSYPKEKSHLFPQGLPSLPPGAGSTQDEYEREMEMLTLAIRLSEEEERLRREREERELREVVRRVEETENAASRGINNTAEPSEEPVSEAAAVSSTSSPKQGRRSSWFRPPLASKFSTSASPPASPPLSPQSIDRPGLESTPTESTTRSGATSFRSAVESQPFTNLIPTGPVPHDLSSRIEPRPPQRRPPPPPHPTRLPPSPPETPVVSSTPFPNSATSYVAPPIPPLPASYSRSRRSTAESERSGPFLAAHSEAFRHENDGSPVEMPYLTPSASNSIRSLYRGAENGGRRASSWALEERNESSNSGGSGSGTRSESASGHSVNRRSGEITGGTTTSGHSPQNRSEEGHGEDSGERRLSFEEGDDNSIQLAIRNPDASPAPPVDFQHQGRFVSEPPAVDVPRDIESADPYLEQLDGPLFSSAYAGRSMSAIDEQTEPASSIIAEEGGTDYSRQGSYPSTDGSMDSTVHRGGTRRVLEGLSDGGGEPMRTSITYQARPIEEREWMHDSVLRRRPPPPSNSLTPTPPRRESPPQANPPQDPHTIHARQTTASSGVTNSSAGARLSFPLPPFTATLPPMSASPVESNLTSTTVPDTPLAAAQEPPPTTSASAGGETQVFADGTRFGHPSICAREPGHVCPHDGLDNIREVPESVELTALMDEPSVGLGLNRSSTRRREETGGKSILRDAWAVEARSWGSLLRFLMWYGETRIIASPQDVALEPTRHCTAAASLEFRPDDEGFTIIRLVIAILPPDDPESHSHRELSVDHPAATTPPVQDRKGKGKARSYFHSATAAPVEPESSASTLATFHLPDSVHLPCRLSNLAIQLYTLRHLASIARSTQPAKEGGTSSYLALRELATALEGLTAIAQSRQEKDSSSSQGPSHYRSQTGGRVPGGGAGRSDENERLLTRLRDRLRRLKRGGGGNEGGYPTTSPTKPNKLVKPPPTRKDTSNTRPEISAPTLMVQQLSRTERVLSANDHEHGADGDGETDVEEIGSREGSGNHYEVDGQRWSMVRREPTTPRREGVSDELGPAAGRRDFDDETRYMPILRS
ncbi:hypothetical protein JCM11491_004250 [Sporobolomyces phaffii]